MEFETDIEKRYIETFCNLKGNFKIVTWQHFTIIRKKDFGVLQFSVMERLLGYLISAKLDIRKRIIYIKYRQIRRKM